MTLNELRKDYLLDRWVVIATARSRRPTDFAKQQTQQAKTSACPMCPSNEHMTPPASPSLSQVGKRNSKDKRSRFWKA